MELEVANGMVVWGLGNPCHGRSFCTACRGRTCPTCCPGHIDRHHAAAGGAHVLGIDMVRGRPAVLGRQVKATNLGFDWRKIQRKMETGQKKIMLLRHPQDRRYRSRCMQCRDPVPAKSDYCSPSCKVLHRPNGQNAQIIQDLVNTDFTQEPVRDRFCLICLRAFASAHCPNHALHLHGADGEEAGAAPNPAPDILEVLEHDGWKLVPGDALGPLQDLLKRINVNGVQMVAVRRRHMQDAQGANVCANLTCNESVDEAGDLCCIQCFFDMQFPMQGEEEEEDDEEPQSPPQDSEGEDED